MSRGNQWALFSGALAEDSMRGAMRPASGLALMPDRAEVCRDALEKAERLKAEHPDMRLPRPAILLPTRCHPEQIAVEQKYLAVEAASEADVKRACMEAKAAREELKRKTRNEPDFYSPRCWER